MSKTFRPKVSIVIPVYNGSNYLKEAIDSALAQTYKNIEIIVINDGSNDHGKTDKICKSYGKKIRYFVKENGGVASALNMGIEKMEGDYFSWLSHDDVYYPEKVEKQINLLARLDNNKYIPYSNYYLIDKNSQIIKQIKLNHKELIEKPEYALLRGSINGITLLIPKGAFEKFGKFDESLKCTQDYDMWKRFVIDYQFMHMEDILTMTRIHAQQDSNKHPNVISEGENLWISIMESFSKNKKIDLEKTEYNYYKEMLIFLRTTPYTEASNYAEIKMNHLYRENSKSHSNIKVSIIIPFYNRAELLFRSINSVKKQTHKNWELILINDGSTENLSRLKEYVRGDNRIKIINISENCGPAKARNLGIENSTGCYIAFLDSDDEFEPKKVEKQLKEMILTDYDVSHTSYIRRNKRGDKVIESGKLNKIVIPEIIKSCRIATPTVMIKTEYLKKNKFKFREDIRIGEDTCFWLEILRDTKLLGIEEPLTVVNVNEKSSAHDSRKHLEGLTNIIGFVLTDKEYSKYHEQISNLCRRYVEISQDITSGKESGYELEEKIASMDKVSKLLYLFKYQGIPLTIKKIIWKYVPKAINKAKSLLNGKR